jgi:hypothetical protein
MELLLSKMGYGQYVKYKGATNHLSLYLLPFFINIGGGGSSNSRRHLSRYSQWTIHMPQSVPVLQLPALTGDNNKRADRT